MIQLGLKVSSYRVLTTRGGAGVVAANSESLKDGWNYNSL